MANLRDNSPCLVRWCSGGLKEAMETLKEFKSIYDMLKYFKDLGEITSVHLYDVNPDNRIGWPYTYMVCVKEKNENGLYIDVPEVYFTCGISKEKSLKVYNEWKNN